MRIPGGGPDAGQRMNQLLMRETAPANPENEVKSTEIKKDASVGCCSKFKKVLAMGARVMLGIGTLGISELVIRGVGAYKTHQATSQAPQLASYGINFHDPDM